MLEEHLQTYRVKYRFINFGEIELLETLPKEQFDGLVKQLGEYGIEIIENQKTALVQKIKDAIIELVRSEEPLNLKLSVYLAEKLQLSYGHLSNVFSEVTYTSIENFVMIQKIEYAKHLIINEKMNLTEISYQLNYSSVAHLSTQFKNITGITPSQFQRIISKRRELAIKK